MRLASTMLNERVSRYIEAGNKNAFRKRRFGKGKKSKYWVSKYPPPDPIEN